MSEIYLPSEDSYLLSKALKKFLLKTADNDKLKVLEIGVGSGIQLLTLKDFGVKDILGVDINKKSVHHCKQLGFNCVYSDLFSKVIGEFDLIIFNSPYLPEDKREPEKSKIATTGGKKGSEILNRLLKQAKEHLAKNGKIFLVTSSLTKGVDFHSFRKKIVGRKKIFFEELWVWELKIF